jgi:hypothetical protein
MMLNYFFQGLQDAPHLLRRVRGPCRMCLLGIALLVLLGTPVL